MSELESFREQLAHVEDVLVQAEESVDGFVFTAQGELEDEEAIRTTIGTNPKADDLDPTSLLGNALFVLAEQTATHPAVLGHAAVQEAIELQNRS
ncbi:MAG: hypothetical protein ABEH59_13500 [Halobacteriales archaeon]